MIEIAALVISLSLSVLALGLSVVSVMIHYAKRAENPHTAALEGEVAELSDKLYSFMKREAARQRRAAKEGADPADPENVAPARPPEEQTSLSLVPPHLAGRARAKIG